MTITIEKEGTASIQALLTGHLARLEAAAEAQPAVQMAATQERFLCHTREKSTLEEEAAVAEGVAKVARRKGDLAGEESATAEAIALRAAAEEVEKKIVETIGEYRVHLKEEAIDVFLLMVPARANTENLSLSQDDFVASQGAELMQFEMMDVDQSGYLDLEAWTAFWEERCDAHEAAKRGRGTQWLQRELSLLRKRATRSQALRQAELNVSTLTSISSNATKKADETEAVAAAAQADDRMDEAIELTLEATEHRQIAELKTKTCVAARNEYQTLLMGMANEQFDAIRRAQSIQDNVITRTHLLEAEGADFHSFERIDIDDKGLVCREDWLNYFRHSKRKLSKPK